ncbi:MAG: hypothetical protein ACRDVE_21130 [Actinocrinis sp.]
MTGQQPVPAPEPGEGVPRPQEVDAQQLLEAASSAIEAARRQAARLFDAPLSAEPESDDRAEGDTA